MPLNSIPAINANICSGWSEQDANLYNRLDFYLAKMQADRRRTWTTWRRFLGRIPWKPNMGDTMRSVTKEPSPHLRQFAFPNPITQAPKKDVIDIRERRTDEVVYRHRFESLVLQFLPSFRDFLDHVDDNSTDIMEKEERFEDIFYRGRIFHNAPNVWINNKAGGSLVASAQGVGNDAGTNGKTTAMLAAWAAQVGNPGYLSFEQLNQLITVAENDLRVPPFSGSDQGKDNVGMDNKFVLVTSAEAFNQFTFDPWLLQNKNCALDVVNERFKGSIFGRITAIMEDMPLRMKADGTFEEPEVRELNPALETYGQTTPNPDYVSLDTSPFEWAFLVGAQGYDVIDVGPPPSAFSGSGMPKGFGKMFWNGEIEMTKNILIPCVQDDGTITYQLNQYGEYLQFISQVTYGMRGKQKRNIIPILFKRKRGA